MNDPGGASTLTGVCQSRRLGGLVRPDPKPGFGSAGAHLDTNTNIRGSAKRIAAFTLQHGAMLTPRQPEGCVPVVVSSMSVIWKMRPISHKQAQKSRHGIRMNVGCGAGIRPVGELLCYGFRLDSRFRCRRADQDLIPPEARLAFLDVGCRLIHSAGCRCRRFCVRD
jgi:hypothetical protein